ncbi:N-acetylmuramic acid 6-phosphate etherase [Pectinatus frisingensis]|uniref:N-acetylmuramic acid 6-phosphate etherase n=1 Tax=Pectinatus frisingensis TaxID=865 RepID=UPI0018C464A6|nr:N-acetylmuramic acid 6-phosphate etherase [Pectinatus frisingensis]
MIDLKKLNTENRNSFTMNIDTKDTFTICRIINNEDKKVADAVEKILPAIAAAIDNIVDKLKKGGRLFYLGAGTSGRLGILDAAECPPTYSISPQLVQGIIAGGKEAVFKAQEGAEDNKKSAEDDLKAKAFSSDDVLVGLAASGRTPYVIGGLKYARGIGATTISAACCSNSAIARYADFPLEMITGPEVITGSTRMKAGTAQKMLLNMLSTAVMIKLGKVYQNLMVDVHVSNLKLQERAVRIIMAATDVSYESAVELLKKTNGRVKLAIVMHLTGADMPQAQKLLACSNDSIRQIQTDIGKVKQCSN